MPIVSSLVGIDAAIVVQGSVEEAYPCDSFVVCETEAEIPYKGSTFLMDVHSKVPMECSLLDPNNIAVLSYTGAQGDSVMQVFRASADNIHDVQISMLGEGESATLADNFESYSSTSALRSAWVASKDKIYPNLDTSMFYSGAKSCRFDLDRKESDGEYVTMTFPSAQNWSTKNGVSFYFRSQLAGTGNTWALEIYDGSNWASINFTAQVANRWELKALELSNFSNISNLDMATITKVRGTCVNISSSISCWFDDFYITGGLSAIRGRARLISLGSNPIPTTLGTPMVLDEGNNFVDFDIDPRKEPVIVHIHYGSHNPANSLVLGQYYGILLEKPAEGTMTVCGSSTKTYNSGNVFKFTGTTPTALNCSFGFQIFCVTPTVLDRLQVYTEGDPKHSSIHLYVMDYATMSSKYLGIYSLGISGNIDERFSTAKHNVVTMNKMVGLGLYYMDDPEAEAEDIDVILTHRYCSFPRYL